MSSDYYVARSLLRVIYPQSTFVSFILAKEESGAGSYPAVAVLKVRSLGSYKSWRTVPEDALPSSSLPSPQFATSDTQLTFNTGDLYAMKQIHISRHLYDGADSLYDEVNKYERPSRDCESCFDPQYMTPEPDIHQTRTNAS